MTIYSNVRGQMLLMSKLSLLNPSRISPSLFDITSKREMSRKEHLELTSDQFRVSREGRKQYLSCVLFRILKQFQPR